jgi:hypothetical protein
VNVQQRRFLLFLGFATCALLVLMTLPAGPFALPQLLGFSVGALFSS